MVLAHYQDFERVKGQWTDFDFDGRITFHPGQKAKMASDVGGRITLEVRRRQSAKMPFQ
jgi:hypothetical protein